MCKRVIEMRDEPRPIRFTDLHSTVSGNHAAARVEQRATGVVAEKVDQQLLLTLDAIRTTMSPEAT